MKDKRREERLLDIFLNQYSIPKSKIYTGESLLRMIEYCNWLEEHGLKAAPSGYPDNFKEKKVTKPKGRNPRIVKRNKDIAKLYGKLHTTKRLTPKEAMEKIAKKYGLKYSTIETIIKRG